MNYKTGPQDGKSETYGPLGPSGNFTIVGFASAEGALLFRCDDSGNLYTDSADQNEFGDDDMTEQEKIYLRKAGWER